jgi:ArsR family metal-binding transcriptional regulator
MLIEQYELRVESPPCDPGSERWSAFAQLSADISAALPHLNARLKGAIYDHSAQVLTWRTGGRAVSVRPHEIAVSNLEDRTEAQAVVQRMVDLVNSTWEERDSIQPSLVKREPLKALAVYKLLPGQNCKACEQPTCFTFALRLVSGQAQIGQCPPLFTAEYQSSREHLLAMLGAAGVQSISNVES